MRKTLSEKGNMRLPFFIPEEFTYCQSLATAKEVFGALVSRSAEHAVTFFEAATDDETWVQETGGELIFFLFRWFNHEFLMRRLSISHAKRVARKVQEHFFALEDHLEFDIRLLVDHHPFPASSLMFGAASEVFREIIWHDITIEKHKEAEFKGLLPKLFPFIQEFVYTGTVIYLWKEEFPLILNVLRQATYFKMHQLAGFSASVFKRYLNRDNLLEYLLLAQKQELPELAAQCCELANDQQYGIHLTITKNGKLDLEITQFTENGRALMASLYAEIAHVSCSTAAAEEEAFVAVLRKISRLDGLHLQGSPGVSTALIENLPNVEELDLSYCHWLTDEMMVAILNKTPRLVRLTLKEDVQLGFRTWGALAFTRNLAILDISDCHRLSDEELDLICFNVPNLVDLRLAGCDKIGDVGVRSVVKNCVRLASLDLSKCRNITEQGFIEIAATALRLETLILSHCSGLTSHAVLTMGKFLKNLHYLDVMDCDLSEDTIRALHQLLLALVIQF